MPDLSRFIVGEFTGGPTYLECRDCFTIMEWGGWTLEALVALAEGHACPIVIDIPTTVTALPEYL